MNAKPDGNQLPPEQQEMPLIEHLLELRNRLLKMVLAVLVCFAAIYPFANELYLWLSEPIRSLLPVGQTMIATDVTSPFFAPLKLALVLAVFAAIPIILYQLWSFIAPGLYAHEKRLAFPLLFTSVILFYAGAAFAYYIILPLAFNFFLGFQQGEIGATSGANEMAAIGFQGSVQEYLNLTIKFVMAFGICFQLPVLLSLMGKAGLVSSEGLGNMRKYAVVAILVVAAIATPPDVISQVILFTVVYGLYEISIQLVKRIEKTREARMRAEGTWIDPDEWDDDEDEEDEKDGKA